MKQHYYRLIRLTDFRTIREKENQLIFEYFDGTNIQKLGSFKCGIYCSLEKFSSFYSWDINLTNEEILHWLDCQQEKDIN